MVVEAQSLAEAEKGDAGTLVKLDHKVLLVVHDIQTDRIRPMDLDTITAVEAIPDQCRDPDSQHYTKTISSNSRLWEPH